MNTRRELLGIAGGAVSTQYLDWMQTSKNGHEERDGNNNHGTCWVLQAGEFARC
jgi:hypothetical protein